MRFSGSLWECRLLSVLVLASQDVVCRLPETVEAAVLCSLSCGRGLGRGFAAVVEKLVCAATVLPSPQPSPTGEGQVAADSGVAGRLKKNARNINGRNFSGSLYRKADGTNAASVFSDDL